MFSFNVQDLASAFGFWLKIVFALHVFRLNKWVGLLMSWILSTSQSRKHPNWSRKSVGRLISEISTSSRPVDFAASLSICLFLEFSTSWSIGRCRTGYFYLTVPIISPIISRIMVQVCSANSNFNYSIARVCSDINCSFKASASNPTIFLLCEVVSTV